MSRKIAAIVAALLCSACGAGSAAGTTSEVGVSAPNSWSVRLAIMPADGATHVEVLRDGRPIDAFPVDFRQPVSYTDYLLWPSTSFTYEIRALDGNGQLIDSRRVVPPADGSPIDEVFTVSPDHTTATVYTVDIPPDESEAVPENNARSLLVSPAGRKRRLLVIEGAGHG